MKNNVHIVVDYDSTLANSLLAICRVYNNTYKNKEGFSPAIWGETSRWDMKDQCPLVYKDGGNILDLFSSKEFFEVVTYFENAVEVMNSWHDKGYEVTICTAGDAMNVSRKVLELDRDFPYANLVPVTIKGANGVGKSIVNMKNAIFVDDHIENLKSSNADFKILYKDEKANKNTQWSQLTKEDVSLGIIEVNNWLELKKVVENIVK